MSETPQLDIAVPVRDEERDLGPSVVRLVGYLRDAFPFTSRVTIADNGSTDGTWLAARALEARFPEVRAVRLDRPGRGRALHQVWSASDAEVLAYMDVDLSTDLNALLPLVAPLLSGHSDVAIGTRLARGSRVVRGPKREIISRCYNLLLRVTLRAGFTDAQCGFKAIRACPARELLPLVEDRGWFFDTELLILAERAGLRIHEVPVDWIDDPDSRVDIVATALGDLRGIARLGSGLARGTIKVPRLRSAAPLPRQPARPRLPFPRRRPMSAATVTSPPASRAGATGRLGRLWRGPAEDPRWARPALFALLAATALLYLAGLSRNGYANDFYAAAVQAGTRSWKAFFFGSFDSSSFITVDKTPASLWVDELSARVFGFSSWSLLAPQALEGVGSVLLLFAAVRRWFGPGRRADRRRGARAHPRGRAHVPLQQPRRAAGAADDGSRVRRAASDRARPDPVAGAGRSAARVRLPDQDGAGVPGAARVRARLPVGRAGPAPPPALAAAGRARRRHRRGGVVGRGRRADAGRRPALLRRLDQQQHPRAGPRLQRARPARRVGDRLGRRRRRGSSASAARPARCGCSRTSSAVRSAG